MDFTELLTNAMRYIDDDPGYLWTSSGFESNNIPDDVAIVKILTDISNFKTRQQYNKYAIAWTNLKEDGGDVIVSIYSREEIGTSDPAEKCNCSNYDYAHELILDALTNKYEELFSKKN